MLKDAREPVGCVDFCKLRTNRTDTLEHQRYLVFSMSLPFRKAEALDPTGPLLMDTHTHTLQAAPSWAVPEQELVIFPPLDGERTLVVLPFTGDMQGAPEQKIPT